MGRRRRPTQLLMRSDPATLRRQVLVQLIGRSCSTRCTSQAEQSAQQADSPPGPLHSNAATLSDAVLAEGWRSG